MDEGQWFLKRRWINNLLSSPRFKWVSAIITNSLDNNNNENNNKDINNCDNDYDNDNDNCKDNDYDNENDSNNFTFLRIVRSELISYYILQVPEYSGAKDKNNSEDSVKSLRTYILTEHSPASMETVKVLLG